MAHDDDTPESGADPWAELPDDDLPELEDGFSFSLAEESVENQTPETGATSAEDAPVTASRTEPASASPDLPVEPFPKLFDGGAGEAPERDEPWSVDDAAIDAWLGDAGDAAASAEQPAGAADEPLVEDDEALDFAAGGSTVEIGTGTSGIASRSSLGAVADADAGEADGDPFAAFGDAATGEAAEEMFAFATESATPAAAGEGLDAADGLPVAAAATSATVGAKRPLPPRRKKPGVVGQMIGVVAGGAMAIPIALGILLWGFGKDPVGVAGKVPESLAFLLPATLRPGADLGTGPVNLANAPSLDDVLKPPGDAREPGELPQESVDPADAAGTPGDAAEPAADETAAAETVSRDDDATDDPLLDLLHETAEPAVAVVAAPEPALAPEPAPAPEPEPLDLTNLDAVAAAATAALDAVAAVDDPADPVRKRLLAEWCRSLAGYAEELVNLESLAVETGRPFAPAAERAAGVGAGLAEHPRLVDDLGGVSRDWIAYTKRNSDGVVMPATFVSARRTGPYWRSQVALPAAGRKPAAEIVVLSRDEPAVAPGDGVLVTGLVVDDGVIWAVEVRPATTVSGFPGL